MILHRAFLRCTSILADSGAAGKAAAINELCTYGVKIIADDVGYFDEPFFQDGMIAQAVDSAYNSGVAYFTAAGNMARQSYELNFTDPMMVMVITILIQLPEISGHKPLRPSRQLLFHRRFAME